MEHKNININIGYNSCVRVVFFFEQMDSKSPPPAATASSKVIKTTQEEARTSTDNHFREQFVWNDEKQRNMSDMALNRILFHEICRKQPHKELLEYDFQCRPAMHLTTFINQLQMTKTGLSKPKTMPSVILCPLNINAGEAMMDVIPHDHSGCVGLKQMQCPRLRGNHWVVLIIDSRAIAKIWSVDAGGAGTVTFWDPLGNRMQNTALKQTLLSYYPKFWLNEMIEPLQSDDFNCATWTALFLLKYMEHVTNGFKKPFSLASLGIRFNKFEMLPTNPAKNEAYINAVREHFQATISVITPDENIVIAD